MSLMDVGRVCYKIAGREAGKLCVIVDVKDRKFVIIDGNVRRKLCNVSHLEPTDIILKIKKGASTSEVHAALQKEKLEVKEKKKKEKKTAEKPKKKRKISSKEKVPKKEVKKKK
ncbi:50S ribosomal protein L14e [Candidatus Woesearchaeota archaeon]|nr:50S ribosomal protein L14e [Candidatus Woesearchaeota archaeon]